MAQKQQISQQIGQRQQLKLSQQQLLVADLLEGSIVELEEKVRNELDTNPALEGVMPSTIEEGDGTDDGSEEYDGPDSSVVSDGSDEEVKENYDDGVYLEYEDKDDFSGYSVTSETPEDYNPSYADGEDLTDYLISQIDSITEPGVKRQVCRYIIGCLDENGYLKDSTAKITDDIRIYSGLDVKTSDVLDAILTVQSLDPAGVCARSVAECLRLQCERQFTGDFKEDFTIRCAIALLDEFFDDFIGKKWQQILRNMEVEREFEGDFKLITKDELESAVDFIRSLNPHPCQLFSSSKLQKSEETIIPDFYYDTESGRLTVNTGHLPKLSVNEEYVTMLKQAEKAKAAGRKTNDDSEVYLRDRIKAATNFIEAVSQRLQYLTDVMTYIIKIQKVFFNQGCDDSLLKPLTMKQVAEAVGCDISTVSRVANNKYISVDGQYTFKLKHFFSEKITTDSGDSVSNRTIMELIRGMVDAEDKSHPLTDDAIAGTLQKKGYNVARRTVAKYRDTLKIPSTRERRAR